MRDCLHGAGNDRWGSFRKYGTAYLVVNPVTSFSSREVFGEETNIVYLNQYKPAIGTCGMGNENIPG